MLEVKKFLCIIICSLVCSLSYGQTITDMQFFDILNLDNPGLQKVKLCVNSGDYTNAKKEYVAYLKNRTSPKWYFDWKNYNNPESRKTNANTSYADRYVNNELVSCGVWHKFENRINWTSNFSENNYSEWTWQLNRHHNWVTMGQAYWETGNEKYAKAFVNQLNSWLAQCPPPNNSGNYIGSPWRTLEAGLRTMSNWPNAFFYFLGSPFFDDESIIRMVKSFYEHGRHLRRYNSSNNWLTIEMNGLFVVGAMFPEFNEAEEWRMYASNKLYEEEVNQFYPDGAQVELSPGYHANSASSIVSVYKIASLNGYTLPKDYVGRLEQIYEMYLKLMMPDRLLPAVNDAGWVDCQKYLEEGKALFPSNKEFEYILSKGEKGRAPSFTSTWMPWAGWYVMRSGWDKDAFYSLFEVGPYGADHQHEDKLSFIISAYGHRLITECGLYAYDNSKWYDYSISARGHNVARVDGKDQNRKANGNNDTIKFSRHSLINYWKTSRRFDYGEGQYFEGFGSNLNNTVVHNRSIKYVKNKYWIVTDTFTPRDDKNHTYDIWFHFNTDNYESFPDLNIICSKDESAPNIAIVRLTETNSVDVIVGQEFPEVQGWISVGLRDNNYIYRPVATPVFHNEGTGVLTETFVFIPFKRGERMPIKAVKKLTKSKYRIIIENGKKYTIKIGNK